MLSPHEQFRKEQAERIESLGQDTELQTLSRQWLKASMERKYVYNFDWLGRPIIQYPQDMVAVQELVWRVRPDLIIETGVAHGGSLVLSASLLAMLDMCDAIEQGGLWDPRTSKRKVVGIDIDVRAHNRTAIEAHPMSSRITLIEGSSVDPQTIKSVSRVAQGHAKVLVFLDSMHTHDHVLQELKAYAPMVTPGSYCVVFDTFVEDMPEQFFPDRPWDRGNNPKTAVWDYVQDHPEFVIDNSIDHKLLISVAPSGFLKRIA